MHPEYDKYTVASAENADYNGEYEYDSEVNSRHCYKNSNNKYLYYNYGWNLGPDKGITDPVFTTMSLWLNGEPWIQYPTDPSSLTLTYTGTREWEAAGAGLSAVNQIYSYYDKYELNVWGYTQKVDRYRSADGNYYLLAYGPQGPFQTDYYFTILNSSMVPLYIAATNGGADLPDSPWATALTSSPAPTVVSDGGTGFNVTGAGRADMNGHYSEIMGQYWNDAGAGVFYELLGTWYFTVYEMWGEVTYYYKVGGTPDSGTWLLTDPPPAPTISEYEEPVVATGKAVPRYHRSMSGYNLFCKTYVQYKLTGHDPVATPDGGTLL
jgi:hypothetical protein